MANWQSLYHYTILYWPTGSPYITILYSTCPLAVPVSLYYTLLAQGQSLLFSMAHWQSLYHYTILFCSTGSPYITTLYSSGPLAVPLSLYYTLWPTGSPYITILYSIAHWQSLYHYTILYHPLAVTISLYHTLLAHWLSLYHYTILYWPTGSPYITILYSIGPLAVPISIYYTLLPIALYYTLLAHLQSLYRSTTLY